MIRVNDYAIQKGVSRQSVYQKMKKPKNADSVHFSKRNDCLKRIGNDI